MAVNVHNVHVTWDQVIADDTIDVVIRRVAVAERPWSQGHAQAWDEVNVAYSQLDLYGVLVALVAFEFAGHDGLVWRACRECGVVALVLSCADPTTDICAGCQPVHGRRRAPDDGG